MLNNHTFPLHARPFPSITPHVAQLWIVSLNYFMQNGIRHKKEGPSPAKIAKHAPHSSCESCLVQTVVPYFPHFGQVTFTGM